MKAPSVFNLLVLFSLLVWFSCTPEVSEAISNSDLQNNSALSLTLVPGQVPIPNSIKSVQFHKKGTPDSAPIFTLGTNEKLTVTFDELSSISGQFIVRFTHHNRNWEKSNQPDILLFEGFNEITVQGGNANLRVRPNYHTYSFEFPNREIQFKTSGNYLMHVYDFQSGTELFSMPFFVTEKSGELYPNVQTIFSSGLMGAAQDEVYGEFQYPDFVLFPQFELKIHMYQNRFWSEFKQPREIDTSREQILGFRLNSDQLFPSYFDFNFLDLEELSLQNPQIFGYEPGPNLDRVILKDDFLNFSSDPRIIFETGFGRPNRNGRYVDATFRFEDGGILSDKTAVYLLGDFNQWTVNERFRMVYNPDLSLFETNTLLKRGSYQYKYVEVESESINSLSLNDSITKNQQEYTLLVYYQDPEYLYDRILAVSRILSGF